ncbi:MAG: factor-independent urate hydroxylase [Planctomycetota bacterium]
MNRPNRSAALTANSYGKSKVRLTKVIRRGALHDVLEMAVDIRLEGDFAASYTDGDNTRVVATDSMKNTVYVLAKETDFSDIDAFATTLARHFVTTYSQVDAAEVAIEQTMMDRIGVDGQPHDHAFTLGRGDRRTCRCRVESDGAILFWGGVRGLEVLKSAGSQFVAFVEDRYRTLPDSTDRIFATSVDAEWRFSGLPSEATAAYAAIRSAMLACFAENESLAVQQTLLEMGEAALDACSAIDRVEMELPNQHRVPFDLKPFGLENPAEIFVPTDEPYGLIAGVVERAS